MNNEKNERCRYIKTIRTTYTDIKNNKVDAIINSTTEIITKNGGKIITITSGDTRGVGVSTVYFVYTIVYEAFAPIPDECFPKKNIHNEKNIQGE